MLARHSFRPRLIPDPKPKETAHHEQPAAGVFPGLRLFVITCVDPRVDPAHFLGLSLGDAMVVRNVGGRVTPEVINDVAFIGQLAEGALPTVRCSRPP